MLNLLTKYVTGPRRTWMIWPLAMCIGLLAPLGAGAQPLGNQVTLSVVGPQSGANVPVGGLFQVNISLSSGDQLVDGAEAHLRFDPSSLQVSDFNGGPATAIQPGSVFDVVLMNRVDNAQGTIDFAGATLNQSLPHGDIDVGYIVFRSIAPSSPNGTDIALSARDAGPGKTSQVTANGSLLPLALNNARVFIGGPQQQRITPVPDAAPPQQTLPVPDVAPRQQIAPAPDTAPPGSDG